MDYRIQMAVNYVNSQLQRAGRGQVSLDALPKVILVIVVTLMVAVFAMLFLAQAGSTASTIAGTGTTNNTIQSAISTGITAISQIPNWFSLIILVFIMAVIIGVLALLYLASRRGGMA